MSLLIAGSANAGVGIADGMAILRDGGDAIDAVVATIRQVEANPDDHSVGYGGLPNLLGDVELDASLMDGRTLGTGAVAALQGYQDAIELARIVKDGLPHVLLAGGGAARLANESGLVRRNLLTDEALGIWRSRMVGPSDDPNLERTREMAGALSRDPERPHDAHGTVNVIAMDASGNIASGVSTSGWAWKYPGRVGDSPIIGAGNYADVRFGAAACTGRGEMAQRCCTAHSVVTFMRFGLSLEVALQRAIEDLHDLEDPYWDEVNIVAIDRWGHHAAASTHPGRSYVYMDAEASEPRELPRWHVPPRAAAAYDATSSP